MANGLLIGVSLVAGVTLGWQALLLYLPIVVLLRYLQDAPAWRPIAVVVLCVLVGTLRAATVEESRVMGDVNATVRAEGVVVALPTAGGEFERTMFRLERVQLEDGTWRDASGTALIYLPDQHDGVSLRDRIVVGWMATHVADLPPDYASYIRSQGASVSAWVSTYEIRSQGPGIYEHLSDARRSVSGALQNTLPGDAGALASGMVTGDDAALSDEAQIAFRRTGTAHVTAVSGQNVSLLLGFLALWMRPLRGRKRIVVHALMIAAVWLYALMVGLEPPAMRAATVASVVILGAHVGRRPDPLTVLSLTLGAMAVIDPGITRSIGFWLSAVASWALCSVVHPTVPEGFRRQALNLATGPVAASLATLPILIWTFGEWSPLTPLANAVLSPVITVLFGMTYLLAGIALAIPPVAPALAWIPGIGLDAALAIVHRMASIAPALYVDGLDPMAVALVAIACAAILLAIGRDSARWTARAARLLSS